MSEQAYDDGGGGGLEPDAPVDDGAEVALDDVAWTGVSREEWDAAQEQLARADALVQAVQWRQEQDQAAQLRAQWEASLPDPLDDPAAFMERAVGTAVMYADQRAASYEQQLSQAAEELKLSAAAEERDELLGHHPDPAAAVSACDDAIEWQIQQATAQGMPLEEAVDRYYTRENALEVIAMFNAAVEQQVGLARGDETSLPAVYFSDDGSLSPAAARIVPATAEGRPEYASEAHRQLAEQVLRRS